MRKHWKFFLACGLVLTFATLAEPPEVLAQRGTVEGVVTLDGQPIKDAIIQFENLGRAGKPIKAKTNKKGRFNRYFIPIGRYKVSVHIDNDKVWENVVDVCSPGSNCLGGKDSRVMPPIALRTSKGGEGGGNQAAYAKLNQEFQRGRDMFTKKNFTMAALAFRRAAEMDPDQHVIHAFLGDTYRQMRKYDQAVGSYRSALTALAKKSNPNSEVAYRRSMASALAMAGKGTEAYAAVEKVAELAPEKLSDAYFRIAAAFVRTGKSAEAVEAFRKSLKADAKNAESPVPVGCHPGQHGHGHRRWSAGPCSRHPGGLPEISGDRAHGISRGRGQDHDHGPLPKGKNHLLGGGGEKEEKEELIALA